MDFSRYSRQTVFHKIGIDGQKKLFEARAAVIGLGALGTVIANSLCRSGVGFLRLIDRDYVELGNLQRQTLYDERDAAEQTPKAVAAAARLAGINSEVTLEPVVTDVNPSNIEALIKDMHIVLDGSDNAETRQLINEACHKLQIPWIYGGVLGSLGTSMNILYGDEPCFRCFMPKIPAPGEYQTCATAGVLNTITAIIASVEATEAIKILLGSPDVRRGIFVMDVWENSADYFQIDKNPDCPVCGRSHYELLGRTGGAYTASLCGRDSVQIVPGKPVSIDFERLAEKLKSAGEVSYSRFMLSFDDGGRGFKLFSDGRAIIQNVNDAQAAKSVYSEYIGL